MHVSNFRISSFNHIVFVPVMCSGGPRKLFKHNAAPYSGFLQLQVGSTEYWDAGVCELWWGNTQILKIFLVVYSNKQYGNCSYISPVVQIVAKILYLHTVGPIFSSLSGESDQSMFVETLGRLALFKIQ